MWFLYAFGLVDGAYNLIIGPVKDGFILRPHCQDDLDGLAQALQAFARAGIGVAIGKVFVLVPACADA